ncbi:MAG: DNA mismatch repair protein MutS [Chloroflexi bacterium]|nr:DNA mismatch repair protein MutS [Chloroflexota bacterium]
MFGREHQPMSPLRRQYLDVKRRHPDALLLFRLGDFYEMFDEDAEVAARELEIVLTSRDLGKGDRSPMAGVPAAAVDAYVARLIARGHRVAIAEQLTEPNGRGPVERDVVRVVTAGTLVEDQLLPALENNYLAALLHDGAAIALAYLDLSTSELAACQTEGPDAARRLRAELARLSPAECLVAADDQGGKMALPGRCRMTSREATFFSARRAGEALRRQFGVRHLESLGLEQSALAARAIGALLEYVGETLPSALKALKQVHRYDPAGYLLLDGNARRNLELTAGLRGGREGSLLAVLDRTRTPMGARLLRAWVCQPLLDLGAIRERHTAVRALVSNALRRAELGELLQGLPDLERLATRLAQGRISPRELRGLASACRALPHVSTAVAGLGDGVLSQPIDACDGLVALVEERLAAEPPATVGPGTIREGCSAELDELRTLSGDTRRWIVELERAERQRTGVASLKVGHNRVFGYYLEVSQAATRQPTDYYQREATGSATIGEHLEKLGYARKQTLAGAERYVTDELKEYETKAARADEEAERLERRLYLALVEELASTAETALASARAVARLDVLRAFAESAVALDLVEPLVDDSRELEVHSGRHPVVEASLDPGTFVSNDTRLTEDGAMIEVVTGPNMAGKSTYLRQVALIALMAQAGSFVPARSARVGLVDRIFTRIGAQDDLAGQRSTFMVEMTETASVLLGATRRSLVILDEVGRGTSTYDGMAIARSVLEHLHDEPRLGCRTLFATHYHELAELETDLPRLRAVRMDVLEQGREVVFLHRVVPGGADRSYGVHVARLAGVPPEVTARAEEILEWLERRADGAAPSAAPADGRTRVALLVAELVRRLDPLNMSPLQALAALEELRRTIDRADEPAG